MTTEFLSGIHSLGKHLGPVFIQLSENFSAKRSEELFLFFASLPVDMQFFIDVRHPDFFEPVMFKEFSAKLKDLNMGIVITDTAGRRDVLHMCLTIPKVLIRFVGNNLHPTDFIRIDAWVDRLKRWFDKGLQDAYFFIHLYNDLNTPQLSTYLTEKLKAVGLYSSSSPVS